MECVTTCIFDIKITDTMDKQERKKKVKYLKCCLEMQSHSIPLVYSVGEMVGGEARTAEKRPNAHLDQKWQREYSEKLGFIRAQLYIAMVRDDTLLHR